MSKVFITQEVAAVDYAPAAVFGDLVFVTSNSDRLSPIPSSVNNANTIARIRSVLADFAPDDYLVCTGAPTIMSICGAVLGDRLKRVLVWDGRAFNYFVVELGRKL